MKIVSFNVAGFRACLKKGFEDSFNKLNPDVICLQEVKALQGEYNFHPEGYYEYLNPADKKGYSGVLVYSKIKPLNVSFGMNIDEHDHEGRMITLEYDKFFLVTVYVPNVKRDLSRLEYRMKWEDDFKKYLKKLEETKPVIVCGDFNVAHTEMDIKNAKANIGNAGFTYEERDKFTKLLESGFIDTFRYFYPEEKDKYTWWSYMGHAREKNIGWRLDYFIVTKDYINNIKESVIYDEILGSDHCPIGLELK
jgi:exodeoxyribonuclease-3